jgi:hypothetical protein
MVERVAHPRRVQARRPHASGYRAVHRPSRWGNPFAVAEYGRARALKLYEAWLEAQLEADPAFLEPLRGYNLGCFCRLDEACHADILLRRLYGATTRGDLLA